MGLAQSTYFVAEGNPVAIDLVAIALAHPCAQHPLFSVLRQSKLSSKTVGALLRNYDVHASVLRRLLLKVAAIMPEQAVGFVLENVRTEYGAGDVSARHQLQLIDLAHKCGVSDKEFVAFPVQEGVKEFVKSVARFYNPEKIPSHHYKPAIAAGAITATEVLAIEEFKAMQIAFSSYNLQHHIWFDHVEVEVDHSDQSVALAQYFMTSKKNVDSVLYGLNGVLDANMALYDGLLAALNG